jgi:lipoate-protein ligase A
MDGLDRVALSSIGSELRAGTAARQMAVDAALIEQACEQSSVLVRCYRMTPPAVTIGRHQRWARVIDEERCAERGWDWTRRPTGGGALLHRNELNYAVTAARGLLAPVGPGELRAIFCRLASALVEVIRDFGIKPDVNMGGHPITGHQHGLCGRSLTGYEIAVNGRKLVAAAQLVTPRGVLQHGTVYLHAPLPADNFWPSTSSPESHEKDQSWADLGGIAVSRSWGSLADVIELALAHSLAGSVVRDLSPPTHSRVASILRGWNSEGFLRCR